MNWKRCLVKHDALRSDDVAQYCAKGGFLYNSYVSSVTATTKLTSILIHEPLSTTDGSGRKDHDVHMDVLHRCDWRYEHDEAPGEAHRTDNLEVKIYQFPGWS